MKILIDITHPAHVHFFKNAAYIWKLRGNDVRFVTRDKEITIELLQALNIHHEKLSRIRKGLLGLSIELIEHDYHLFKIVRNFRPDIMLNIGGTFIVHVGKLLGIKTCVFTDTEHAKISNAITFPFATWICTPTCFKADLGEKHIKYNGYQELAYLHPNFFQPNPAILNELGITTGEKYFLMRFISWGASHDIGKQGITLENKIRLVKDLGKYGRVLITSESSLPDVLKPFLIRVNPVHIHDLLYYAFMYIGEGATMATEAALLGTPSVYINPLSSGNLAEIMKRYQLIVHKPDGNSAYNQIIDLAANYKLSKIQKSRYDSLLKEKIDVTNWMVELVESIGQ